jgi:hypothetical protein
VAPIRTGGDSPGRSVGICASRFPIVDVEELLAERGLHADHVTVWRWVQRYALEMERRLRRRLEPTSDSWRVDFDLHPGQGQVGVFIPGCGLHRGDDRLPSLGQTRCSGGRARSRQSAERSERSGSLGLPGLRVLISVGALLSLTAARVAG